MKKLSIHLDNNEDASHSYYPGNSVTGNVRFDTSASVKYTCVKIRFVGTVATKLAKTTEEVYVLSDQVVLLGNANNASESVLPQGRHCWSFAFDIPLQHIPSTGKYRHGTVKYTLTATVASKSFLGSMQEIKSNKTVQVQDLVSCRLEPYCNPVAVQGSSNTKPDTNKPKNLASATVHLPQSAFVKGQNIQIVLDLAHPRAFHRDPACWIQLVRKESYRAGDQTRDYTHIAASSTIGLHLDTAGRPGKAIAEITLPKDCLPTMFTTRIISVQYHLLLLFDMRPKTGMFERKNRKTLSRKVRTKLLDSPGGFEIEVPIVIATVSDPTLEAQPKPWTQLRSSPNEVDTSLATAAASQLSLGLSATSSPSLSASPSPLSPYATLPGQYPFPSTLAAQNGRNSEPDSPVFTPRTQYHANAATIGHASQWRASPDRRAATDPGYQSLSKASSSSSLNYEGFSKPLPTIPSSSRPTPTLTPSTHSTFTSQAALFAVHTQAHDVSSGTASTTASSFPQTPSSSLHSFSSTPSTVRGHNQYPREKENFISSPAMRQIQLPQSLPYQSASAPSAVDLGLGSASPAPSHQQLRYLNSLSFSQFGSASEGSGSGSSFRAGAASSGNGQPPRLEYRLSRVPDIKTGSAAMRLIQRSAGAPQVPDSANQSWSAHTLYQTTSPVDMSAQRPQQQQQHYMPHPQRHGQHGASTYSSSSSQPSQFQPQTQYQPSHAVNNNRNSHIDGSDSDPVPPYSAVSL